jgi:transposase
VQIALKLDLVGLVLQAIDGTKIEARCRGQGAFDQRANRQLLAALEQAIAEQEQAIEEAARTQLPPGPELPKELCGKKKLRQEVVKALFEIEEQGRKHCQPKEPEARRMPGERGNRFSYNAQVAVDAKEQIIVAAQVVAQENDQGLLVPLAQAARENTGGATPASLADGGYASSEQFAAAEEHGLEVITPLPNPWRNKQGDPFHSSHFVHKPKRDVVRCPQGRELPFFRVRNRRGTPVRVYRSAAVCKNCPLRAQCTSDRHGRTIEIGPHHQALLRHRAKLLGKTAAQRLGQRARIVEPIFAQIKQNGSFRRWSVGGLDAVRTQWALLCTSWNLRVMYRRWCFDLSPAV